MANIEGLDKVIANLNAQIAGIQGRTIGGLLAAGLHLQAASQKRVPVEYGNLRASAFTRKAQGDPQAVEVGYSAAYAVFVHENVEEKLKGKPRPSGLGTYWNPGESKFLEKPAREESPAMLEVIADRAQVRG